MVKARTHFMADLPYLELCTTNDRQSQTVSRVHGSRAAFLAAAAIAVRSGAPLGTSQLPPTHGTASSASQSGAVACVMPPVGQKRHRGKGAESALRAGMPPAAMAGKNLNRLRPISSPRMMSPAVAMPGRKGNPDAIAAFSGFGEAGRDNEARAGFQARLQVVFVQHGAGADNRALHLRHLADRVERDRGAQRHLQRA